MLWLVCLFRKSAEQVERKQRCFPRNRSGGSAKSFGAAGQPVDRFPASPPEVSGLDKLTSQPAAEACFGENAEELDDRENVISEANLGQGISKMDGSV